MLLSSIDLGIGGFVFGGNGFIESGVDGIADFESSGLDIGGGELAGFFASNFEVGGSVVGADGGEDGTIGDFPWAVGLDEDEAAVVVDGGDAADEAGFLVFCGRFGLWGGGFISAGGEEDRIGHQTYAEKPQFGFNFHRRGAEVAEGTQSRISDRVINNRS